MHRKLTRRTSASGLGRMQTARIRTRICIKLRARRSRRTRLREGCCFSLSPARCCSVWGFPLGRHGSHSNLRISPCVCTLLVRRGRLWRAPLAKQVVRFQSDHRLLGAFGRRVWAGAPPAAAAPWSMPTPWLATLGLAGGRRVGACAFVLCVIHNLLAYVLFVRRFSYLGVSKPSRAHVMPAKAVWRLPTLCPEIVWQRAHAYLWMPEGCTHSLLVRR